MYILIALAIPLSPLWISLIIRATPRWLAPLDAVLCLLQTIIAYLVWWFFWGGGIGGEGHVPGTWQWLGLVALLPFIAAAVKHLRPAPPAARGFPVMPKPQPEEHRHDASPRA